MPGNAHSGRPGGNPNRPILGPGKGRAKGSKNRVTLEQVEGVIRDRAFFDPRRLLGRTGLHARTFTLKEIAALPLDVARCIASFDVVTENLSPNDDKQETVVKVRWYNPERYVELLAKHFKYVDDKVRVEVNVDDLAKRIEEGRRRNAERER